MKIADTNGIECLTSQTKEGVPLGFFTTLQSLCTGNYKSI